MRIELRSLESCLTTVRETVTARCAALFGKFHDTVIAPVAKWNRYRRTVAQLQALNDRTLSDIGVERWQIEEYAHACVFGSRRDRNAAIRRDGSQVANDNVSPTIVSDTGPKELKAA